MNAQAKKEIEQLRKDFKRAHNIFFALGDENRQNILITLLEAECGVGMCVSKLTEKINLSRPTVSHHLKVMQQAGIINIRKVGTNHFYMVSPESDIDAIRDIIDRIDSLTELMSQ